MSSETEGTQHTDVVHLTDAERKQLNGPLVTMLVVADGVPPTLYAAVERIVAERLAATAPRIRRAINDPGAFVKRGPDYDGNEYGERLDQWQDRAIAAATYPPVPTEEADHD